MNLLELKQKSCAKRNISTIVIWVGLIIVVVVLYGKRSDYTCSLSWVLFRIMGKNSMEKKSVFGGVGIWLSISIYEVNPVFQ